MPLPFTQAEIQIQTFMSMKEGWEKKDWRRCADLMVEDGVLHSVMLEPCQGRENFYERIKKTEKPNKNVILHIRSMAVSGHTLYVERSDEIIVDGVSRFVPTVGILEFRGEKIAYWREYYDRATMLKAVQEIAHN